MSAAPRSLPEPLRAVAVVAVLVGVAILVWGRTDGGAAKTTPPVGSREGPAEGLVLARHPADDVEVVDGDTLRLPGGRLVRVLGLDTEERYRSAADAEAARLDFDAYARAKRGDGRMPVKYGTPAGLAASDAAHRLVAAADHVRVEQDASGERAIDPYGRFLGHVLLETDAGDVLLAERLIEAGHSPAFVKYGRSLRFADRLDAAEEAARSAGRGIWSENGPDHYPDYPERLRWWRDRAAQVDRWRARLRGPTDITLGVEDEAGRLAGLVGRDVTVFGTVVGERTDGHPRIFFLSNPPDRDFKMVVFDDRVWQALDIERIRTHYVMLQGRLKRYHDRLEIVVDDPDQVKEP